MGLWGEVSGATLTIAWYVPGGTDGAHATVTPSRASDDRNRAGGSRSQAKAKACTSDGLAQDTHHLERSESYDHRLEWLARVHHETARPLLAGDHLAVEERTRVDILTAEIEGEVVDTVVGWVAQAQFAKAMHSTADATVLVTPRHVAPRFHRRGEFGVRASRPLSNESHALAEGDPEAGGDPNARSRGPLLTLSAIRGSPCHLLRASLRRVLARVSDVAPRVPVDGTTTSFRKGTSAGLAFLLWR